MTRTVKIDGDVNDEGGYYELVREHHELTPSQQHRLENLVDRLADAPASPSEYPLVEVVTALNAIVPALTAGELRSLDVGDQTAILMAAYGTAEVD